jgi:hypothetical protein
METCAIIGLRKSLFTLSNFDLISANPKKGVDHEEVTSP